MSPTQVNRWLLFAPLALIAFTQIQSAHADSARFASQPECRHNSSQAQLDIVQLRSPDHRRTSFFARNHAALEAQAQAQAQQQPQQQELAELTSSFNPDDQTQLEAAENFFFQHDRLQHLYSVSDYGLMALVARAHAMTYGDLYMHLYDSHHELRASAGPAVDAKKCLRQLTNLVERVQVQEREKYYSKDLNLYQLLDSWGHFSSGVLLGNVFFTGTYHECKRLRIQLPEGEPEAETRYCVLTAKHVDWPKIDRNDLLGLKGGVCLPKACDSTMSQEKEALLMRLVDYQLRRPEEGQVKFSRLYCLPDEDSPARSLWNSRAATLTLAGLGAWLALLALATYKHSRARAGQTGAAGAGTGFGLTNVHCEQQQQQRARDEAQSSETKRADSSSRAKLYQVLSVAHNLRLLFDTSKESSLMETGAKLKEQQQQPGEAAQESSKVPAGTARAEAEAHAARANVQHARESINAEQNQNKPTAAPIVDLRPIEGIKVIAMTYVIMGHVLMCMPAMMYNGREFSRGNSMAFFMANLVPAFAVNSFFTITGLLTGYLILKQNQSYTFITSPAKWFAFIVYRYLRIMPLYALVVLYCKTLAKFTGSGPLWDYGTSSLSQRRACEQETWDTTLLFKSNYLPPLQHCIPGGWYLSNDFQFFLVTPLYLALLHTRPRLGKFAILASIVAGYAAGFYSIWSSPVSDLRPIANFAPHGFKTYISHLSFNYTRPQYRIPAYLIGLLMGHQLFSYEAAKRRAAAAAAAALEATRKMQPQVDENGNEVAPPSMDKQNNTTPAPEPDWSQGFKRRGTLICLLLVTLCCITPIIGAALPFTLWSARLMVALITPSYHVLFALAIGLYLLLATTGNGNARLNCWLAKPFWKPLARLSLCAVLVNVEVINYIVQGNTSQHYITNQYHITLNCLCIVATYAVSTLVCVLFEAPIRGALNGLLTLAITRVAAATARGRKGATGGLGAGNLTDEEKTKVKTC